MLCSLWYLFDNDCFNLNDRIVADDRDKPDAIVAMEYLYA